MKVVIFAGGIGTRLWPLSRRNTPKQFEKIIGDKSTLQETVNRLIPDIDYSDIYIATGKRYESIITDQLLPIPKENFIFEPQMRDVGPAIGLVAALLQKKFPDEPVAILWSDHLVKNIAAFKNALSLAEEAIKTEKSKFVFIAQKPRFANQNMGWIEVGEEIDQKEDVKMYSFKSFRYRPTLTEAITFYNHKNFVWNLGYFVSTPRYLSSLFETFAVQMHTELAEIGNAWGTSSFENVLESKYPELEKISFDDLILIKMNPSGILVISADLEWSDVGAWESLKEALSDRDEDIVTKGNVLVEDSQDSLVFNYTKQLLVGIDLNQMLVINTEDVVLVCPKTSVPKIKKLVEKLKGTEHEHLT
ncbi:MAG TPA: sugar phosphate nucleotidyltransferase [Candidatus Saccharimonadales bacterium]|nr:sugar phosphate nucleotidyltransferase [Candidatus Saccharimonadales bacterium]